ncbi:hypothetical protein [Stanieria cyanosphaera]|uniref:hypothetical protein n=1 Tax=Stanieria cyanosphaera TaxID=102116 RepID=UPI0012371830|nr:hypothetical protein [Stanieria cyanosphaera]
MLWSILCLVCGYDLASSTKMFYLSFISGLVGGITGFIIGSLVGAIRWQKTPGTLFLINQPLVVVSWILIFWLVGIIVGAFIGGLIFFNLKFEIFLYLLFGIVFITGIAIIIASYLLGLI